MALQSPGYVRCIRDPPSAQQADSPTCSLLEACPTWQGSFQLALTSSIKPLLFELQPLLDDLGIQRHSTTYDNAKWNSTLSTMHWLLRVLRPLLDIIESATSCTGSSSTAPPSSTNTEAMCADFDTEHQQIVLQICRATGQLLERLSATLDLTAAISNAAQRAVCQKRSLAAGHAAHELLASVKHPAVLAKCQELTLKSIVGMALSATRILCCEMNVSGQHRLAAKGLSDFGASIFTNEAGVESQADAVIDLVLEAAESGAMLQGTLCAAEMHRLAAINAWMLWLPGSVCRLQALLSEQGRNCRSAQVHRLATAACEQLQRLQSASDAGDANFTSWQACSIASCSNAAYSASTILFDFYAKAVKWSSSAAVHKGIMALQTDILAMAHAGVLHTLPRVARWLLMRTRAVAGSSHTAKETESDSSIEILKIRNHLPELASVPQCAWKLVCPHHSLRSPVFFIQQASPARGAPCI